MPEFNVIFMNETSSSITVEAEDEDAAIEAASEQLPGTLCHQCAGYRREYSREEGDWEPSVVYDAAGNEVWASTVPDIDTPGASS